jgi:hypothetical protein
VLNIPNALLTIGYDFSLKKIKGKSTVDYGLFRLIAIGKQYENTTDSLCNFAWYYKLQGAKTCFQPGSATEIFTVASGLDRSEPDMREPVRS